MKILITGAAGFVGDHLARELEAHGHRTVPVDRDDGDLAKPQRGADLIERHAPDHIVHLAARYGRLLCADAPHESVSDNAAATTEIAQVANAAGVPVLYASSSEVYGDHGEGLITEKSALNMPTTIYGLSKRWGEEALRLYMPPELLCIVRMNMLYGPRQQAGYGRCALATFIDQALRGEPFTVHQAASRSWLYISDAVRALRLLVENGHAGIFNLGNDLDRPVSMIGLAELVCEAVPEHGGYDLTPPPAGQIRHKNYSSARLRKRVDWRPKVGVEDGIRGTVDFARTTEGAHA